MLLNDAVKLLFCRKLTNIISMKFKLLFISLLIICIGLTSCKSYKESRKVKKAEKEVVNTDKQAEKDYKKLVETHYKRQPQKTKEMMEESKRRSEYYNQSKKRSFWERLFGTKKHKKPTKRKKKR